jgi:hypothetical protein
MAKEDGNHGGDNIESGDISRQDSELDPELPFGPLNEYLSAADSKENLKGDGANDVSPFPTPIIVAHLTAECPIIFFSNPCFA